MEYKLKSHEDKLLINHLQNVANSSRQIINNKFLNLKLIEKNHLANISYIIGISHDFGKATIYFQDYILEKKNNLLLEQKAHSPISSYFGYLIINEYCKKNNLNKIFSFLGAFLIKRHHGNLDGVEDLDAKENYINKFKEQLISIRNNKEVEEIYNDLLKDFNITFSEVFLQLESLGFGDFFFDEKTLYRKLKKEIDSNNLSYELFLITELLFSVLVDCDKKDAAGFEINNSIKQISENCTQEYLEKKKKENLKKFDPNLEINKIKNDIFNSCADSLDLKKENKIYSITAPTGAGKTLTSLATALRLKYLLDNKENYKIHYVLPFTTIIDQNYEVFREVLSKEFNESNENDYLMKHHYLTTENIKKQNEENGDYDFKSYMDELLFIKSWDSALVVSSYVQLLETIIGGKNSFMNKFHNIVNSIIILDEVQCISSRYWDVFRNLFKELSEKFNVYFIFLTATQPLIFNRYENKQECIELANPKDIFGNDVLDRVNITLDLNEKTIEEFFNRFCELESFEDRYLFILNTKKSSLELYNKIKKDSFFKKNYEIVYLSTNLTPFDRRKKLEQILGKKKNDSGEWEIKPIKKYIVVTTQLVEAGVDISSDVCYRDFAPIDSIIQSAGRVNRFGELGNKKGNLFVIKLRDDRGIYSKRIYNDGAILEWTENVIKNNIINSSKDFYEISKKFFEETLREDGNTKLLSEEIEKNILKLNFSHDFKFIENKPTHSVFILDNNSKGLIEQYKKIYSQRKNFKDFFEWKGELKRLRRKMQNFIIELWPNDFIKKQGYLRKNETLGDDFYYVDIKEYPDLYNSEIGFNLDYEQNNIF
jgi:CRISPR-associated endonuclease/helicase Cas3